MVQKIFDIIPPYPEEKRTYHRESPKKKEKRKAKSLFFNFILFLFIFCLVYVFIKAAQQTDTQKATLPSSSSQFELFDNSGNSSFTPNTTPIIIRIMDGAPNTTNAATARSLLLKNRFQIEKTDTTSSSLKTIVYYKQGQSESAQKVSDALKDNFSPTISESQNLENSYDILLIIGTNK